MTVTGESKFERDYFEKTYRNYSRQNPRRKLRFYRKIVERVAPRDRTPRILDIGCAFGAFLSELNPEWKRFGMDVSGFAIDRAAQAQPFWIGITFQRYYKGPATSVTVPPLDVHIVRFDLFKEAMTRPNPMDPVLEAMANALKSGHRVWWVQGMGSVESGPPPVLPPAPLPDSGWYIEPYLLGWARQAAYHLESHGQRAEVLDTRPGGRVLPYENVAVTMVSGWR